MDFEKLTKLIIELELVDIADAVQEALEKDKKDPFEILETLTKGMDEVGRRYEDKEYYLTELVLAGETMKEAFTILKPALTAADQSEDKTKIILVTVKGDNHDIGKNILGFLLLSSIFELYDLGMDVDENTIVIKVKETGATIVALSSLLTMTVEQIKVVHEALIEAGIRDRVSFIVGGAPLNRELAKKLVSFDIKSGETVGLVGESGCGKTTIANAILNIVDKTDGEILFHSKKFPAYYGSELRQKIQIVFQDPNASLNPRIKIFGIISEPIKNFMGITNTDRLRRIVLKLMEQVSLKKEHMDRYPHEFLGGQKQRIVIARALACNPELIILDEPTSALDVSVQAQILNILRESHKKYNFAFLFITHNLSVVHHIADKVVVMYLGKIVEFGSTEQVFDNPSHPYTIALLKSRSEIDYEEQDLEFVLKGEVPSPINSPSGCYFNPKCVSDVRTSECEYKIPHKIEIEENHYIW